jgi:hypothetical protein
VMVSRSALRATAYPARVVAREPAAMIAMTQVSSRALGNVGGVVIT